MMAGRKNGWRQRVRLTLRKDGRTYWRDVLARDVDEVLRREGADLLRVDRLKKMGRATA